MGIATTTSREIRLALIPLIQGITPTAENHRSQGWSYIVEGNPVELRNFTLLQGAFPRESFDGIHGGDGIEYEYPLHVRTGYHGLPEDEVAEIVEQDGRDLWLLLHPKPDGAAGNTIAGLLPMREPLVSELVSADENYVVVDHILEIHYKAADS